MISTFLPGLLFAAFGAPEPAIGPPARPRYTFSKLAWSDEFNDTGLPDSAKWTYDVGGSGWEAWPWNQPFHLLLNVAVGGEWGGQKGVDEAAFPQQMVVDYVRFYQLKKE